MGRLTMLAFAFAVASAMPRNAAAERYYPWCAYYNYNAFNCGFVTREQCLANVISGGGHCRPNPNEPPVGERRGRVR